MTAPGNFKVWRFQQGWSQERMAEEIGVSADVIRTIEKGGVPTPANRVKVAKFFDCEILDLWPLEMLEKAA